MNENNISFSIVCPLYNKEKYIKDTIESVLSQTYVNWELIIIDDGSTDNSVSVVQNYLCKNIILLHRSHFSHKKGGSVSRNIGIKHAKGSYLLFLDADDVLSETCLEQRRKYIIKYPEFNFYIFDIIHFVEEISNIKENRFIYIFKKINYYLSNKSRLYFLKKFLKYDSQWSICNVIWQKETLFRLNGFNENFQRLQDPEIHTRALLDSEISFKFLKYTVKADVYVRSDQERSNSISPLETFFRVSSSITEFILQSQKQIIKSHKPEYLKYLNAYVLLFEQIYNGYYYRIKQTDFEKFVSTKNEFYSDISSLITNHTIRTVGMYRYLSKYPISRKLRIPAIYVYLYKIFL